MEEYMSEGKYQFDDRLTEDENRIIEAAHRLRMPHLAEELHRQYSDPNTAVQDRIHLDLEAFESEINARESKKFKRLLRNSGVKYSDAELDDSLAESDRKLDVQLINSLATGKFLEEGKNLLVTGKTGTGKTYIVSAICIAVMRQYKSVYYVRSNWLCNEFDKLRGNEEFYTFNDKLANTDLLVIDDFGLMPLDPTHCREIFEVLESRDRKKSTIMISQIPVAEWWDLFRDETYADSCLSRITYKAYRLICDGPDRRRGCITA